MSASARSASASASASRPDQRRQPRRAREPARALPAVGCQRRRALERLRRRRMAAALDGALGRLVERLHDALVGLQRRRRQVPGAAIGLLVVALERGRERPVDRAPLVGGGGPVDRGADQRVAERDPPARDRQQPRLLGRVERELARGEGRHRALDDPRALGVVGRRGEQREPRRRGQPRDALVEHALEPARHRQRLGQRLVARELGGAQRGRQLDERQRVAVGLLEQPLADLRRRGGRRVREQLGGRRGVEPLDRVRRHVGRLEHTHVALARGEQEHDALGVEPPCDELQRVRGPGVEPMRVVDEAQHRPLLGELGQQRQAGGVDEEALLPAAVREPERGPQRGGLGRGQAVD